MTGPHKEKKRKGGKKKHMRWTNLILPHMDEFHPSSKPRWVFSKLVGVLCVCVCVFVGIFMCVFDVVVVGSFAVACFHMIAVLGGLLSSPLLSSSSSSSSSCLLQTHFPFPSVFCAKIFS